ncbi:uncharacterized protein LOC132249835 [Alligator mississippiensis]|uniref:uncharacterized protein LOC132249835 n=1 Tax=Alligator mississippiensis TaxID=8496 RepID=UPI00287789EE|nr:uncharacterized protein LOC132249835 [Alligator mississippiensis]
MAPSVPLGRESPITMTQRRLLWLPGCSSACLVVTVDMASIAALSPGDAGASSLFPSCTGGVASAVCHLVLEVTVFHLSASGPSDDAIPLHVRSCRVEVPVNLFLNRPDPLQPDNLCLEFPNLPLQGLKLGTHGTESPGSTWICPRHSKIPCTITANVGAQLVSWAEPQPTTAASAALPLTLGKNQTHSGDVAFTDRGSCFPSPISERQLPRGQPVGALGG